MAGLVVGLDSSMARAADANNGNDAASTELAWNKVMTKLGLKKPLDEYSNDVNNYMERPPLVVPPTRDLPPPLSGATAAAPNWPKDAGKPSKNGKNKNAVVPATAVQTPNPPIAKKPWYDPSGWFNKEEYANFTGEPVRDNLTDPPAGYRIPSPDQPYGINPDNNKRPKPKTAAEGTPASAPATMPTAVPTVPSQMPGAPMPLPGAAPGAQ